MISLELSTIQAKDQQRAMLAEAMASFTGQIEQLPGIQAKPIPAHSWRGDLVLPGGSTNTHQENQDAALATRIRELTEKGAGVSAISHELKIDNRRVHRIAKDFGIKVRDARSGAQATNIAAGQAKRAALLGKIRPLAEQGRSIANIANEARCSRDTVMRIIEDYGIKRGPKMKLEA